MKKYIIRWNAGFGDSFEEVEVDNESHALDWAEENFREESESNADYEVMGESTDELRNDYL